MKQHNFRWKKMERNVDTMSEKIASDKTTSCVCNKKPKNGARRKFEKRSIGIEQNLIITNLISYSISDRKKTY